MMTFKGYPEDGGLYTGYNVFKNGQKIGTIEIGGYFRQNANVVITETEKDFIRTACKKVYEMPSEYGCLGVGETPTEPFSENHCGDANK